MAETRAGGAAAVLVGVGRLIVLRAVVVGTEDGEFLDGGVLGEVLEGLVGEMIARGRVEVVVGCDGADEGFIELRAE